MYIKKLIGIILSVSIILSGIITVNAATSVSTTQEKAAALNQLGMLSGDGKGNYNLSGALKRSEAVTFIVAIMGKKDEVTRNSSSYKFTKFPDVKDTAWYAPYVGYCVENKILGGNPDGTFKPNDNISEKAFLSMLMNAMGYQSGTDFMYSEVYKYAYSIGLLRDSSYETKTGDNTNYVRGDVVDILYQSMTIFKKGTTTTVIQSLVREGIIQKGKAIEYGLMVDTVNTAISKISATNEQTVALELNESVKPLTDANFIIYTTADKTKTLTATIKSQEANKIVLKTAAQTADTSYTVELANSEDMEGNLNNKLTAEFKGYKNTEIVSDLFKISKIEIAGKDMINVYFTHPVNVNSLDSSYYQIYHNGVAFAAPGEMAVSLLGSVNNGISLTFKGKALADGEEYTLQVSNGLTSVYGVRLGMDLGDSKTFIGKSVASEDFRLINLNCLNSRTLQLDFNKDLNQTTAEYAFSYSITDPNNNVIQISKATVVKDGANSGKSITLAVNGIFDKTKTYKIMVFQAYTIDRDSSIIEKTYTFSGYYPDTNTGFNVVNATPLDAGTIVVYFDKALDENSAAITSNFMISGVTHAGYYAVPAKTYFTKSNPYVVKLFLSADKLLDGTRSYMLTVQPGLQDSMGNALNKQLKMGFNGTGSTSAKPSISKAVIISNDTIKVTFNKEIALDVPNILNTNYTLEYSKDGQTVKKVPLSTNYIDATTISLKFDNLDFKTSYKLRFATLKDYSGVNITSDKDTDTSVNVVAGQ
jgi:hypothetical protein